MFGTYFYHERIRKSVAMFGSMFNNIYILRRGANNKVLNTMKVPLSYAPKRDYLDRLRENPDLSTDSKVALKLPRMSFEIIGYQYDAARQLNKMGHRNKVGDSITVSKKIYNYVPYLIDMQLNIYTKTQDDALQIVEQILPYFSPQYNLTIKPFSDHPEMKEDVPIILNGISYSDDYEGGLGDRRAIVYQLDFQMHINFYQGFDEAKIIREVNGEIYFMADSDYKVSTITVEPNPLNVSVDSDYGFTETITTLIP